MYCTAKVEPEQHFGNDGNDDVFPTLLSPRHHVVTIVAVIVVVVVVRRSSFVVRRSSLVVPERHRRCCRRYLSLLSPLLRFGLSLRGVRGVWVMRVVFGEAEVELYHRRTRHACRLGCDCPLCKPLPSTFQCVHFSDLAVLWP